MANHASALKAHRQSLKHNARNKNNVSRLRSGIKSFQQRIQDGKFEEATASLPELYSLVDKSVQKTVLSKNAAARRKSRLTRLLNQAAGAANKA